MSDPSTGWPAIIQRMDKQSHQIGSHTWSHQHLDTISGQQRQAQMIYNEIALGKILGRFPTYMRPPFSQCASECQALMADLGYHVINFDVDIEDTIGRTDLQVSMNDFSGNLTAKSDPTSDSMLVIGHETSSDTVNKITEMMLKSINSKGFKAVTVGDCLDDPKSNWYRRMDGSLDPTPPREPKTVPDKPSASSPAPKAASVNMQLAVTSFTYTASANKESSTSTTTAQSASSSSVAKVSGSSSVSQTRPTSAIKPSIMSPSPATLSSSTSAVAASVAKSYATRQAMLQNKLFSALVILIGLWFNV